LSKYRFRKAAAERMGDTLIRHDNIHEFTIFADKFGCRPTAENILEDIGYSAGEVVHDSARDASGFGIGVEFDGGGRESGSLMIEGAGERVVQSLMEAMAICFKFGLGEAKIISVNVAHMSEKTFEQDFILIEFNAINILNINPESMIGLVIKNIADRKVMPMGYMGLRWRRRWRRRSKG
jgi:hypothetical protein